MTLPAFLRAAYLAPAAVGAALFAWRVPINEGPVGKAVVIGVVWLLLAYGFFAFRDLLSLVREFHVRRQPRPGSMATATPAAGLPRAVMPPRTPPVLDAEGRAAVHRIAALFARCGLFAPSAPRVDHLFEATADRGAPVTQGAVLGALHEAGLYHADFDAAACMANLAFHASHGEQFEATLRSQVADIARLARGILDVTDVEVALRLIDGTGPHPDCTIAMTVNGERLGTTYSPAAKCLATHLHVLLASAMRKAGGSARLAWHWDDQGVWLAALSDEAMATLNADPDADADPWEWVDEVRPQAGDRRPE